MKKCSLLVGAAMLGCSLSHPAMSAQAISITAVQQKTLGIAVAPLAAVTAETGNRLPGEIVVPVGQERVVSAPLPGLVDRVYVASGQSVKKGQPLAHVSSPELASLQRDFLQALVQKRLAADMLARDTELHQEGIIAERRYLSTRSNHEELSAMLQQRRQTLKLAGMSDAEISRLEASGTLTSGLTLSAPISGEVLENMVTAGQRIDQAMPVVRIASLNPLWLEIHAPVELYGKVSKGMQVFLPQYGAEGRIVAIVRNLNKDDQTMHIRAEITRNADRLSPGQFVEAELASPAKTGRRFAIPKTAVVRNGQQAYVFVQTGSGFAPVAVEVAEEQSGMAVISGKLQGTEKIAVSGTVAIKAAWLGAGGE